MDKMLDPDDVYKTVTDLAEDGGTTEAEVCAVLTEKHKKINYEPDYVAEWAKSGVDKLVNQGVIVAKGDRYFLAEPATT